MRRGERWSGTAAVTKISADPPSVLGSRICLHLVRCHGDTRRGQRTHDWVRRGGPSPGHRYPNWWGQSLRIDLYVKL